MENVRIEEIERDPLGYLLRVEAGETLVVLRADRAVAEIRPVAPAPRESRPFGPCAGEFLVPEDLDAPLPRGVLDDFEGRGNRCWIRTSSSGTSRATIGSTPRPVTRSETLSIGS